MFRLANNLLACANLNFVCTVDAGHIEEIKG